MNFAFFFMSTKKTSSIFKTKDLFIWKTESWGETEGHREKNPTSAGSFPSAHNSQG